jgi:hypothetical protein
MTTGACAWSVTCRHVQHTICSWGLLAMLSASCRGAAAGPWQETVTSSIHVNTNGVLHDHPPRRGELISGT